MNRKDSKTRTVHVITSAETLKKLTSFLTQKKIKFTQVRIDRYRLPEMVTFSLTNQRRVEMEKGILKSLKLRLSNNSV